MMACRLPLKYAAQRKLMSVQASGVVVNWSGSLRDEDTVKKFAKKLMLEEQLKEKVWLQIVVSKSDMEKI